MACDLIPTDLTDEQQAQVCGVLSVGCDWQTAAHLVGCSLADIRRAIQNNPKFAMSVQRAEAAVELSHMRIIQEAAKDPKNWRTSVWWLERHAPERFGPRSAGVVTTRQLKAFVAILADVLSDDGSGAIDRNQIVARLRAFSESVDRLLRDERMQDVASRDSKGSQAPEAALAFDNCGEGAGGADEEHVT